MCQMRESEDCRSSDVMLSEREGEGDVIDTESLFEYDGALFRLYFQPTLYLRASCEIRMDSRLLLCGPVGLEHAPPAGVEMPLHLVITLSGFDSAGKCLLKGGRKEFLWQEPSWKVFSLRTTEMSSVCFTNLLLLENLQNSKRMFFISLSSEDIFPSLRDKKMCF